MAEFGHHVQAIAPAQQAKSIDSFLDGLPKGSKVTSRQLVRRGDLRVVHEQCTFLAGADSAEPDDMVEKCWIGVPSEPAHFVERAFKAGHPRGLDVHIDDAMRDVVKWNLLDPPYMLAKKRVDFFKKWTARAKELAAAEDAL